MLLCSSACTTAALPYVCLHATTPLLPRATVSEGSCRSTRLCSAFQGCCEVCLYSPSVHDAALSRGSFL